MSDLDESLPGNKFTGKFLERRTRHKPRTRNPDSPEVPVGIIRSSTGEKQPSPAAGKSHKSCRLSSEGFCTDETYCMSKPRKVSSAVVRVTSDGHRIVSGFFPSTNITSYDVPKSSPKSNVGCKKSLVRNELSTSLELNSTHTEESNTYSNFNEDIKSFPSKYTDISDLTQRASCSSVVIGSGNKKDLSDDCDGKVVQREYKDENFQGASCSSVVIGSVDKKDLSDDGDGKVVQREYKNENFQGKGKKIRKKLSTKVHLRKKLSRKVHYSSRSFQNVEDLHESSSDSCNESNETHPAELSQHEGSSLCSSTFDSYTNIDFSSKKHLEPVGVKTLPGQVSVGVSCDLSKNITCGRGRINQLIKDKELEKDEKIGKYVKGIEGNDESNIPPETLRNASREPIQGDSAFKKVLEEPEDTSIFSSDNNSQSDKLEHFDEYLDRCQVKDTGISKLFQKYEKTIRGVGRGMLLYSLNIKSEPVASDFSNQQRMKEVDVTGVSEVENQKKLPDSVKLNDYLAQTSNESVIGKKMAKEMLPEEVKIELKASHENLNKGNTSRERISVDRASNEEPKDISSNLSDDNYSQFMKPGSLLSNLFARKAEPDPVDKYSPLDVKPTVSDTKSLGAHHIIAKVEKSSHSSPSLSMKMPTDENASGDISIDINKVKADIPLINRESNEKLENIEDYPGEQSNENIKEGSALTVDSMKETDDESMNSDRTRYGSDGGGILSTPVSGCLIHGDVAPHMVTKVSDLALNNLILKNLEYRKITDLTSCQMIAIPIVANERNLVMIGPPGTKKTSSWLIPTLDNLLNDKQEQPRNGPKCVIIVPGSSRVRYIARLCSTYVGAKLITIGTHAGGLELERKDELVNGVEILISTPRCFLRLLECKYIISPNRIRYFIFDTAHEVLSRYPEEVDSMLNGLNYLTAMREKYREDTRLQIFFVATMWTKNIEKIALTWLKNPVICITSYLEAAIYSNTNINLHLLEANDKVIKLVDMVYNNNAVRTVIACNNSEEVKILRAKLSTLPRRAVVVAHEEMLHTLFPDIHEVWNCEDDPLLICTNHVLHDLNISDAKWLIHFSLPKSKANFRDRFKFIKEFFINKLKTNPNERSNCNVDIFVDEHTEYLLPALVEIFERLDLSISEEVRLKVEDVTSRIEYEKFDVKFCENILQFGQCWKKNRCEQRHVIYPDRDGPKLEPPVQSFVSLHILDVVTPTHFVARIESYSKKLFNDHTRLKSNYTYVTLKMAELLLNKQNRFPLSRASVGDVVGVNFKEGIFARAKIIDILERDEKSNATVVRLFLIDEGIYLTGEVENLVSLPVELREIPGDAINVFITGLIPMDLDQSWSYTACKFITKKIMELQNDKSRDISFIGQVDLIIGSSLLLDKLLVYENPSGDYAFPWVVESLSQMMLSSNLGILNSHHKDVLRKLAQQAKIEYPERIVREIDVLPKKKIIEECRWAFLDEDSENRVNVIIAEDIDAFFVRPAKFLKCLISLENDLYKIMAENTVLLAEHKVGTICAVKFPNEDRFCRGMIIEAVEPETLEDFEVEIFFVDSGDRTVYPKSEVFELPQGFITRLPFQAIECGLYGIKPIFEKDVSDAAINLIYDLTSDETHWLNVPIKVISTCKEAEFTGGSRYKVVLHSDKNPKQIVLINELMVNHGFAHWDEELKDLVLSFKKRDKPKRKTASDVEETWETLNSHTALIPSHNFNEANNYELNFEKFEITGTFMDNFQKMFFKNCFPSLSTNDDRIKSDESVVIKEVTDEEVAENEQTELNDEQTKQDDGQTVSEETCKLVQAVQVHHPTVYWRQSAAHVWLKILLPDTDEKFKLYWTAYFVYFEAEVNDRLYNVGIDLFGPINPDSVMHKVTGLYFEVRLTKIAIGRMWPRIFFTNTKFRNIMHDPDKLDVDNDENDMGLLPSYFARGEVINDTIPSKSSMEMAAAADDVSCSESDIDDNFLMPMEDVYED